MDRRQDDDFSFYPTAFIVLGFFLTLGIAGQVIAKYVTHGPQAVATAPAAKPALGEEAAVERSGAPLAATGEAVDEKARTQACNQAATEQSLKGAKRKAFVSECMKG